MKYIDADKLIAEIERRMEMHRKASASGYIIDPNRLDEDEDILSLIDSLQQEQPELPPIGHAETYYQKGLHDGIIKGKTETLKGLEEIEKRKSEPVLFIKGQEQPEVDLEKEIDAFFGKWDKNSNGCIFDENGTPVTIETIKGVVKHFLNARKEE